MAKITEQERDVVDNIMAAKRRRESKVQTVRIVSDDEALQEREAAKAQSVNRFSEQMKATSRNEAHANSGLFRKCCELAGIPVTKRQASKFARKRGLAHRFINQARAELKNSA
jgi:hypothetical protein